MAAHNVKCRSCFSSLELLQGSQISDDLIGLLWRKFSHECGHLPFLTSCSEGEFTEVVALKAHHFFRNSKASCGSDLTE
jgi:hypothetical protein